MAARNLGSALQAFKRGLRESRQFFREANGPSPAGTASGIRRRNAIYEFAFLHGYKAWERYLEESFVLFAMGGAPLRGRAPTRYISPPNRDWLSKLIVGDRNVANWEVSFVRARAELFFRNGGPFSSNLTSGTGVFAEVRTIRNAIAHPSGHAQSQFQKLARQKLGAVPVGLSVGSFLNLSLPSGGPKAYFDDYLERIESIGSAIAGS